MSPGRPIAQIHRPAGRGVRAPLALGAFAALIACSPAATAALELSRAAIAHGQLWRLLTGHFTHYTPAHLFWDTLTFLILGTMVAQRSTARFWACTFASALAISATVLLLPVQTYRGLSGIDSALFTCAATLLAREGLRERRPATLAIAALALSAFLSKTLFELLTGKLLFVQDLAGMQPLALAHIVGAAVGFLTTLLDVQGVIRSANSVRSSVSALPPVNAHTVSSTSRTVASASP